MTIAIFLAVLAVYFQSMADHVARFTPATVQRPVGKESLYGLLGVGCVIASIVVAVAS